ncbi:helix-turn-helix domain-containing protein [Pseudomonas aeruginosa]|nr:helix-turn-helix domain-containing protein [Pseudomonas aeruginosa]WOT75949.1 helix-turn-helix domain-containing protein [Pseudomonas aeruginosa]WOU38522.1 helix-turn-helix domain-containing protein [Pseudomonas aeruginosa]
MQWPSVTVYAVRLLGFSIRSWRNRSMTHAVAVTHSNGFSCPGNWSTVQQLCRLYQVSRTTWWRWSKAPGFPAPVRFGRAVRWDAAAVEAFLTQREV